MQKVFELLTVAFRKNNGVLSPKQYHHIVKHHCSFDEKSETLYLLLQASGYPISINTQRDYQLETYHTPYNLQKYCVIDIETNGSKPNSSQVIEIGAVMAQNGQIIDRFESFVACSFLPQYITKVTGIEPEDLIDAPSPKEALGKLRIFMGNTVFVAHNASFDYSFLNASFERFGLGSIGNPKLCTIDLAKRTFESERYGLAHLIESLQIETATHHRAYSDAYCAYKVFEKSLEGIGESIKSADDLIRFSTSSKKSRSQKRSEPPILDKNDEA